MSSDMASVLSPKLFSLHAHHCQLSISNKVFIEDQIPPHLKRVCILPCKILLWMFKRSYLHLCEDSFRV